MIYNPKRVAIRKEELLALANDAIKERDDFIVGMEITNVVEKSDILVFQGEYFLDENGLPTAQSTTAFNVMKWLTQTYSELYILEK
jgi:hypothetical protein